MKGSSGACDVSASATPVLSTMAPADPLASDMTAEKPSCSRRRVLRSWKKVFQSSGGAVGSAAAAASAARALRAAAAASSACGLVLVLVLVLVLGLVEAWRRLW